MRAHPARIILLLALSSCGNQVTYAPGGDGGGGGATPPATSSTTSTTTSTTATGPSSEYPCGPGHPPCPPTEYCDQLGCEGVGICLTRPGGCPEDCPGVCGCNGQSYCNDCEAQAAGVDVGPGGLCPGDVEYRAFLWLGGMDHLVVMRADYTHGTCLRLYADWPSEGSYDIAAPPEWGVNAITASDELSGCLEDQPPAGQLVSASGAGGVLSWQLEPTMYYPCALDLEASVSFQPPPAWLDGEVSLAVSGLSVEGGCF